MEKFEVFKRKEAVTMVGQFGSLWRVKSGCFRLDCQSFSGTGLAQLAFPGDLIGVETLCDRPYTHTATALTRSVAIEVEIQGDFDLFKAVTEGYMQQQFRTRDMVKFRSGQIKDRIQYFLDRLSEGHQIKFDDSRKTELPTNKELADILGTTPETVCRELRAFIPAREYARFSDPRSIHGFESSALV